MAETGQGPGDDVTDVPPASERPGVPRWVKVSGAVAGAVLVVLVALMLLSGGTHGPGRHMSGHSSNLVSTHVGSSVLIAL